MEVAKYGQSDIPFIAQGNCRLRYGLNENCLLKIFEYLHPSDLIQLCELDTFYKDLIMNWTLKKKMLQLGNLHAEVLDPFTKRENDRILQIFQLFGKSMRRFKISTFSFISLFEMISEHCEPGQLAEIEISVVRAFRVHMFTQFADPSVMVPFFVNLRKFSLFDESDSNFVLIHKVIIPILCGATKLQTLKLINVDIHGGWLERMQNLYELRLHWSRNSVLNELINCLRMNPKLKSFKFTHRNEKMTIIGNVLSKSCIDLRRFADRDFGNNYERFDSTLTDRYSFLSLCGRLTSVALTSYTFCGCDLYYALTALAGKKIVKLKVFMSYAQPMFLDRLKTIEIMRRSPPKFPTLLSAEIEIMYPATGDEFDRKWTQCELRCKYMFHFLAQQTNLKYFKFSGDSLSNMHTILNVAPNIRTLHVVEAVPLNEERKNLLLKIVHTLRKIRQTKPTRYDGNEQRLLHLILSYEYKVEKNFDYEDVVRISFERTKPN